MPNLATITTTMALDEGLKTALTSGFNDVKDSVFEIVPVALAAGLAIAGAILAIRLGWRFFKSIGK